MMMLTLTMKAGDRVFDWRSKMAQTALTAVDKFFQLEDMDADRIANLAEDLVGLDERISPFYYREASDGTSPGKVGYLACWDIN